MTELRNVSFKNIPGPVAKDHKAARKRISLFPFNNRRGIFLCRVLTDPVIDFPRQSRRWQRNSLNFIAVQAR